MKKSIKSFKKEYDEAVHKASVVAFIAIARRHPDVTLGEVMDLAKEYGIGDLTIHRLFIDDNFMDFDAAKPKALPQTGPTTQGRDEVVSLRTVKDREEFRLAVLDSCTGEWLAAAEIRHSSEGTSAQVRKVLNDLIEEGLVEYKGQTRNTRYRLTKKGKKAKG